jgi:hypothetical protein
MCLHSPRRVSTFEAGGRLGEPFLYTHRSAVYFNPRADVPGKVSATPGANVHLPAAYAVLRKFLDDEELAKARRLLIKPGDAPPSGGPIVHRYAKSQEALKKALPQLFEGLYALRDAFGRYLELDAAEVASTEVRDIRCVRHLRGDESPWHREDARSHFVVSVMLSDVVEDFEGGTLMVHGGACPSDADAMPVHLDAGDALIFVAPRIDHALRTVEHGERATALFEFAVGGTVV